MSNATVPIEPLENDNFNTWKREMQAILVKKDTWKYVNGSCVRTEDNFEHWDCHDSVAKSDLLLALSTTQFKQIRKCETANEMWQKLHSIYEPALPVSKASLWKSLIFLKLSSGGDMREHLDKFFDILVKLNEIHTVNINDMLAMLLLHSIPEEYEPFRTAIETQDPALSLEELRVKLLDGYEARKRKSTDIPAGALMVHRKGEHDRSMELPTIQNVEFDCATCNKKKFLPIDCKTKEQRIRDGSSNSSTTNVISEHVSDEFKGWCLDSGATSHMCSQKERFKNIFPANCSPVELANGECAEVECCGMVLFKPSMWFSTTLRNTLYVPDLKENLLSVSKICDLGYYVLFKENNAQIITSSGQTVFTANRKFDLYYIEEIEETSRVAESRPNSIREWHERLGHLHEGDLKDVIQNGKIKGIGADIRERLPYCEVCIQGKQSQTFFQPLISTTKIVLELVHSNVCGPMRVDSHGCSRYFVTFMDDYSQWCELFIIKRKSEVFSKFKEFKNFVECKTGKVIQVLRSDNDTAYTSNEFKHFLVAAGIKHEYSMANIPLQNRIAERRNLTLIQVARCMMIQAALPASYWAEALNTANYITNRCPTKCLGGETPFKLWNNRVPIVKHLRIFGQIAYLLNKRPKSRFSPRSTICIFIGYCSDSKAYRLYDPEDRTVLKSRDVVFTNMFATEYKFEEFTSQQNDITTEYQEEDYEFQK